METNDIFHPGLSLQKGWPLQSSFIYDKKINEDSLQ